MKKIIILFLLIYNTCYADVIKIPFSCYPKKIQEKFLVRGYILDLEHEERSKYSWGFIKNLGNEFEIITYRNATEKDFKIIQEILWEKV